MGWTYGHDLLNAKLVNDLVHNVLLQDDLSVAYLEGLSAQQEFDRMDQHGNISSGAPSSAPASPTDTLSHFLFSEASNIWTASTVKLPMPCVDKMSVLEELAPKLEVKNVHHQKLTEVLKMAFKD